jgi:hypothetical protein
MLLVVAAITLMSCFKCVTPYKTRKLDTEFVVFIFVSIFQLIERQAQSNRKVDDSVACHNDEAPYSYMTKLKGTETKSFNNYHQGGS